MRKSCKDLDSGVRRNDGQQLTHANCGRTISAPLRTTGVGSWVKAFRSRESEGAKTLSVTKSSSAASATGVSPWVSTRFLTCSAGETLDAQ